MPIAKEIDNIDTRVPQTKQQVLFVKRGDSFSSSMFKFLPWKKLITVPIYLHD